jgi:HEAT repeat protein
MSLLVAWAVLTLQSGADPAQRILSADPLERLGAVREVAEKGHPQAEKVLLVALADSDWEVAALAAGELGRLGSKAAGPALLPLALEGPVRGLRRAAGEAMARIEFPEVYEKLVKAPADLRVHACEALESLGPALSTRGGELKTKELERWVADKDGELRSAAARALVALAGPRRPDVLRTFLAHEDVAVRASAIEAAGASGDGSVLEPLVELYEATALADFLARRVHAALRALVLAKAELRDPLVGLLARVKVPESSAAHVARALGLLGEERGGARALDAGQALAALGPLLAHASATVRAAATAACGRIASDEALDSAATRALDDADARVRRIAVGVVARGRGAKHEATRGLLLARLERDTDPGVRECAASYLGERGAPEVVAPLEAALTDPDWRVMAAAAVALGKTEHEASAAALMALHARGADDWRARASAVAGLTRLRARAAVPLVIAALEDEETLVARTAYEFLCEIARERLEPKPAVWTKWWEASGAKVKLSIPEEVLERRKRLEYVRSAKELFSGTYVGIDVLVLQSRGDHIEDVLDDLAIEHRRTSSGQIRADGLHPQGVFVANCTGEITADEAERLAWFVRAGGALFGSCWALHETIERVEPTRMRKLETRGEVLDDVPAFAAQADSRYLEGVFAPDTRPVYHLEGAHLIEVLDPEEVEVLVDSPPCAARHGGGNLAAWFRLGHGVVLASANHFEGQGIEVARKLRSPEERMAWAVDHLGLDYARLRELRAEKFWSKTSATAEQVKDLSVFRLITNFVWLKRLAEE